MPLNQTATNHTIELVTTTTTATSVVVSGRDNQSFGQTPISQQQAVVSATTTTISAAPASGAQRQVDDIEILVTGSGTQGIQVQKNNGSSTFPMINVLLNTNERCVYTNDQGFRIFDSIGREKLTMGFAQLSVPQYVTATNAALATLSGATAVLIEGWAPGGGGGGANTGAAATSVGSGGSSGDFFAVFVIGVTPTISVTVGAVGTAGTSAGGNGGVGGDLVIVLNGVTYTAKGGLGGIGAAVAATTVLITPGAAAPAIATNAQMNGAGNPGKAAHRLSATIALSGQGGEAVLGVGAPGVPLIAQGAGTAGIGFNAGGTGALSLNGGAAVAGAAGMPGFARLTYFSG